MTNTEIYTYISHMKMPILQEIHKCMARVLPMNIHNAMLLHILDTILVHCILHILGTILVHCLI